MRGGGGVQARRIIGVVLTALYVMSEQSKSSVVKWLLLSVIGYILLVGVSYVMWLIYMSDDFRAARELQHRGIDVIYNWRDSVIPRMDPTHVGGNNLNITPKDSQLISRLPRLYSLDHGEWEAGDMSGLDLDEIGKNCRELTYFRLCNVKHFPPINDIRKLAACPIDMFILEAKNIPWNDSDLEVFSGFTKLETLYLDCDSTGITNTGLEYLGHIPTLKQLTLLNTSITTEGIEAFQRQCPDVDIRFK